ncbi:hypothetical protein [Bdellovibrio sp. HCB288]|uniref:hypothetical protein n=1 Tax=Bdellovibrio sp. HCB288 TaxID=3394355 RepID=UPI0039B445DE
MKYWLVIFFSLLSSISMAAERFNHITCEYQQVDSAWEFSAVNYNRDGLVLEKGQSAAIVGGWTSSRETNVGFCLAYTGTDRESAIQNTFVVFEGSEIFGVNIQDCSPVGRGIKITHTSSSLSMRGDVVEYSVDGWFEQGEAKLLLKHYVPLASENEKVTEIAAAKCSELRP